jgi:hypothetical protein
VNAQASRPVALTLTAAACGGGLLCASAADASEWLMTPTARVVSEYTDNPRFFVDGGTSTAGAALEASASLRRKTERSDLSLSPRLRSARYEDDETLDSDDQYLDGQYTFITERSQWTASTNFTRDTTLTSELGATGIVQANRRHESLTVSAGPSLQLTQRVAVGAQAYWLDSHYVDAQATGLVDYEYRAGSLFANVAADEISTVTLTGQHSELRVDGQESRTRSSSVSLGWRYRPLALWTLDLSAGPAFVETDFADDSGMIFDANLRRQGERWNAGLRVGRDLSPTGRGVLTQRDQLALTADRRLTERLSASVLARWIRNQDLGISFLEVEYGRLDLSLSWRLAEHWHLALTAGAASQRPETRSQSAENYRTSLSIVWNGQTQSL